MWVQERKSDIQRGKYNINIHESKAKVIALKNMEQKLFDTLLLMLNIKTEKETTQQTDTCSKLTIETLEKNVKNVI